MKTTHTILLVIAFLASGLMAWADTDWFASEVTSYSGLGSSPYDSPGATLGKPTTLFKEPGALGEIWTCSMVVSSWNLAPDSSKIITTINPGGSLVVKFATPIEDDPQNWNGLDFIVYGNSSFTSKGGDYLTPTTDMEQCFIENGGDGWWEPSMVSVAQYPGGPWYDYSLTTDRHADDFAPIQAFAWDNINHTWGAELDFTKPLDPVLQPADFGNLSVLQGIDLYKGSAGGAAFDISRFALPVNGSGRKWIQYIKVTGTRGEVDAFSRVSHTIAPVTVRDAKNVADGVPVIIDEAVVTAGASELGDCCYAQIHNKPCGVKLKGRALERGQVVTIYGVLGTDGDERAVKVTAIEEHGTDEIKPAGMTNKNIGGGDQIDLGTTVQKGVKGGVGPNTIGMLVRTWGRVGSVNSTTRTWTVNDGSGCPIKCAAPPDSGFVLPGGGSIVAVTGICSCEQNSSHEIVPLIRLRDQQDWN